MNWRSHLTPDEARRLDEIALTKRDLSAEARRIFDRARKRAERNTNGKTKVKTGSETRRNA